MDEQELKQAGVPEEQTPETTPKTQKKPKKAKKKRRKIRHLGLKIFLSLLLVLILGGGGFLGFTALKAKYTTVYQGYTAQAGSITDTLEYSSSLQLIDSCTYTAEKDGKVRAIYVSEGDTVTEGQRLMRLSTGQTITADIDGKVNSISVKVDDEVKSGDQLIQIADFSRLQVTFSFSEYDVPKVKVGTAVQVVTTATNQTFDATVTSIDYTSTSRGSIAYYTGKVILNVTDGLYPGMQVTVNVPETLATDTVILSTDALSFDDSNHAYVYLQQEDGSMTEKQVTLGAKNDDYVQISEGLSDGDIVYVKQETETTAAGLFATMMSSFSSGSGSGQSTRGNGNNSWRQSNGGGSSFGGGGMPSGGGGMR